MSLLLKHFRARGDLQQERVVMRANADVEVGQFALCRTARDGDSIYPTVYDTFWFPDGVVQKGDFVVLYTKPGTTSFKKGASGTTSHFYYWGRSDAVWDDVGVAAVLMHVGEWHSLLPDGNDR